LKKKIFFLYPYYWPHYQAGGPVQSLFNLANILKEHVQVYVLSRTKDVDGTSANDLVKNKWIIGPNGENIFYLNSISPGSVYRLLAEVNPDAVLVNGIFNAATTLPGILFARILGIKIFFSPRGMLQSWGLARRKWIKRAYLFLLKRIIPHTLAWHATDLKEQQDIIKIFGQNRPIYIAPNVPRKPALYQPLEWKPGEKMKLVFLSLINPNKNLHLLIDAVLPLQEDYTLDIFGPVADTVYWKTCHEKIKMAPHILYKGAVPPWQIQELLCQYHFFVLPTQGENFGHAIFDALSSSVPVMISKNTPWKDIETTGAGFYLDITGQSTQQVFSVLTQVKKLNSHAYETIRKQAYSYATNFWNESIFMKQYFFLILDNCD